MNNNPFSRHDAIHEQMHRRNHYQNVIKKTIKHDNVPSVVIYPQNYNHASSSMIPKNHHHNNKSTLIPKRRAFQKQLQEHYQNASPVKEIRPAIVDKSNNNYNSNKSPNNNNSNINIIQGNHRGGLSERKLKHKKSKSRCSAWKRLDT